jgi:uncharacterized protein YndB with AHSA1/START domain
VSESSRIEVSRTVDASPEQVFAVLADPEQHTAVDGAGMLRGAGEKKDRITAVGDEFLIDMNMPALGDYKMRNTVVSYEENKEIGWAPELYPSADAYRDKIGDMNPGGHTYTWRMEPAGDGRTKVTQVCDWSKVTDAAFKSMCPVVSEEQMTESIERVGRAAH